MALSRQHELTQRQRHEQHFERLVAESPVGIAAGDLSGKLTLVNDTYLRMLGFSRAEFELGQIDWASLTPPEYRASDEAAFQRAFAVGRSGRYEKEMLTRSGERFPVDVSLIRFDAGDTGSVVGWVQDLRPFRSAEQALREHNVRLEQQVAERTQLLEMHAQAQDVFVNFMEAAGLETNVLALVKQAVTSLQSSLPHSSAVYYELGGEGWQAKTWSPNLAPAALAPLQRGLPKDTPTLAPPCKRQT